jgi:hypothetical protein
MAYASTTRKQFIAGQLRFAGIWKKYAPKFEKTRENLKKTREKMCQGFH